MNIAAKTRHPAARRPPLVVHLTMLAAPPLAALLLVSAFLAVEYNHLHGEAQTSRQLTELSILSGVAIHEIQKERGMTAIFMGSGGSRFGLEVDQQRVKTDETIRNLREELASLPPWQLTESLSQWSVQAGKALDELTQRRTEFTALAVSTVDASGYYSSTISTLLLLPKTLLRTTSDRTLASMAMTYDSLIEAKERTGRERALLSGVFAAGHFTGATWQKFLTNSAEMDLFWEDFRFSVTPEQRTFFEATVQGQAVDDVSRLRARAIEGGLGISGLGVDAAQWFDAATAKINLLKSVEDKLAADLRNRSQGVEDQSSGTLVLLAVLALAALGGTFLFASRIVAAIRRSTVEALNLAGRIQEGDLRAAELRPDAGRPREFADLLDRWEAMRRDMGLQWHRIAGLSRTLARINAGLSSAMERSQQGVSTISEIVDAIGLLAHDQSASFLETDATVVQISGNIEGLYGDIERQAGVVEDSSAAIEQMIANVQSIARHIGAMGTEFSGLHSASEQGQRRMADVARLVGTVAQQSKTLMATNAVIEEIAAATNLLSINAAIEAARAGSAGQGFSVVAHQIRKLAVQAAEESTSIGADIRSILQAISLVVESVAEADRAHATTTGFVASLTQHEREIRQALDEQSAGSKSILEGLGALREITGSVKDSAAEISQGSRDIASETHALGAGAEKLRHQMEVIRSGVSTLEDTFAALRSTGEESGRQVVVLDGLLARFQFPAEF